MPNIDIIEEIRKNRGKCKELVKRFQDANINSEDVANSKTSSGFSPLHYVMVFCKGEGVMDLVQFLVRRFPKIVKTKNSKGAIPINVMPASTNPQPILNEMQRDQLEARLYLIKKFPEGIEMEDDDGETPLIRAIVGRCNILVKAIAERFPESIQKPNGIGKVPLHYAMEAGNSGAVEILYKLYPNAMMIRDKTHKTPADILALKGDKENIIGAMTNVLCSIFEICCECENSGEGCTCRFSHQLIPTYLNETNLKIWSKPVIWGVINRAKSSDGGDVEEVNVASSHSAGKQDLKAKVRPTFSRQDSGSRRSSDIYRKISKKGHFEALRQSFETPRRTYLDQRQDN